MGKSEQNKTGFKIRLSFVSFVLFVLSVLLVKKRPHAGKIDT